MKMLDKAAISIGHSWGVMLSYEHAWILTDDEMFISLSLSLSIIVM